MKPVLIISLLISSISIAASQVYVWTDENGKEHFSDTPPTDDVEARQETFDVHNVDGGYPHTDPDSYKHIQESWADRKKREKQEKAEMDRKRQEHMRAPCQKAREQLSILKGRVAYYDDDGNEIHVSEAQRKQEVEELAADIARYCQ